MTDLDAGKELSGPAEILRQFLAEKYGLYFSEDKLFTLRHKLQKLARQSGCESIEDYAQKVFHDPSEIPELLDVISTNKTYFFREANHWEFMKEVLIPGWRDQSSIQVWSAACSTGQEPYSTAMLLEDAVRHSSLNVTNNFRVLATDLSRSVLSKGVLGKYSEEELDSVRSFDRRFVDRYFKKVDSNEYQVIDRLRRRVVFREYNLLSDRVPFSSSMNLVICRNVLIYFDRSMIEQVIENLRDAITTGGYLFIGHTETLQGVATPELEQVRPAVYRKPS